MRISMVDRIRTHVSLARSSATISFENEIKYRYSISIRMFLPGHRRKPFLQIDRPRLTERPLRR